MTKILVLGGEPECRPAWDHYYGRLEGRRCIYANPSYVDFLATLYGDVAELFVYDEGPHFVYYPYFKRSLKGRRLRVPQGTDLTGRFDIHSSWYYGGPISSLSGDYQGMAARFLQAFREHARSSGCVSEFIRLDPNLGNHIHYPSQEITFNRETVYVELAYRDREEVWQDFNQSNRWAINRARREGIVTVPHDATDSEIWTRFAAIYQEEMMRKNAPPHLRFDEAFFLRLRAALPNNLCLLAAMKGDEMCGAHLIIYDETNAFAFLSATALAYWRTQVNNLLWADAIFWAMEQGRKRYDLQGGREGVFKFKAHFSPTRGKFYTLNAVHDRALFEQLVACNAAADAHSDRFPPYLTE